MSFFEDASLVLIPSAQKTSKVYSVKPTDGTGDLTFTRTGDTATRVGPDGLIEKVRTNLLVQSNTFNTTWAPSTAITVTSGQSGYDGTSNAWLLERSDASARYIFQNITQAASTYTFSVYAKAETVNWLWLYSSDGTNLVTAYFDLATGALGTTSGVITSKIESVGNGWYRCSISYSDDITSVRIYPAVANGSITGGISPAGIFIQNAMLEVGDVMTDYIATTTAAVSVGPVANVPRLDYLNSSCPRLLLEPQRVNKWYFSESFDNAEWLKSNVTISANSAVSPDGYTNADKMVDTTANDEHRIRATTALFVITTATTFSIFAKAAEYSRFAIANLSASEYVKFNLSTGAVISTGANFSNAKIENYGNGWYRLSATTSTSGTHGYGLLNDAGDFVFTGTGTKGVFIYGAQAEEGAYATSYIPTLGAAVTRGADAASKTGISSLIGQTEGTIFVEVNDAANTGTIDRVVAIGDGTGNNRIIVLKNATGNIFFFVASGGSTIINQTNIAGTSLVNGNYKIAVAYKSGEYAIYQNGASVFTSTAATVPATSNYYLAVNEEGGVSAFSGKFSQALLFKTRLSNADLASLTSL